MSSLLWTWSTPYWMRAHSGNHFSLTFSSKIYFVTGPGTYPYINQHVYIKISESFFHQNIYFIFFWCQHLSPESRKSISQTNNPRLFQMEIPPGYVACLYSERLHPREQRRALVCQWCCSQWEMTTQNCHQSSRFYCSACLVAGLIKITERF